MLVQVLPREVVIARAIHREVRIAEPPHDARRVRVQRHHEVRDNPGAKALDVGSINSDKAKRGPLRFEPCEHLMTVEAWPRADDEHFRTIDGAHVADCRLADALEFHVAPRVLQQRFAVPVHPERGDLRNQPCESVIHALLLAYSPRRRRSLG